MPPTYYPAHLILVILMAWATTAKAQQNDFKFSRLTVEEGLPGNTVNSIIRDSRGFIWVASENGVGKFDGYDFQNFRYSENDSLCIGSNIAYVVFEDSRERLWVGSQNGLDLHNRKRNHFSEHYFQSIPVRAIFEDRGRNLWVGSDAGLYRFNEKTQRFEKVNQKLFDKNNARYNTIPSIAEDSLGTLWIGTSGGLYAFDPSTQRIEHFMNSPSDDTSLPDNNVRKVLIDKNGDIWIATYGGGLGRLNSDGVTFTNYRASADLKQGRIPSNLLTTIWESPEGELWVGTDGEGIAVFDRYRKAFRYVAHSPFNSSSLNNNVIRSIASDERGGVWVGTYNGGVNLFDQNADAFLHYRVPTPNGSGSITSFAEDRNGDLWIGTDGGGLSFLDRETGQFSNYVRSGSLKSLSDNRVISLLQDRNGRIWIGTYLGGISVYDPLTKTFQRYREGDGSGLTNDIIWSLLEDPSGTIWIATNNGLNYFLPAQNKFHYLDIHNSGLSNNMVRSLFMDSRQRIWVGTQEGLNLLNAEDRSIKVVGYGSSTPNPLNKEWIRTIGEDHLGRIWIGTFSAGLMMMKDVESVPVQYSESDGLPDNIISALLTDNTGAIWISTARGLARLKYEEDKINIESFDTALKNRQFNINAAFTSRKGELLFGSSDGFSLFNPSEITGTGINRYPPPVAFTSFRIFNREVIPSENESPLLEHINETKSIVLRHDQSVITFEFSALNYIQPEKNRYAYRLQGFEDEWNEVGHKRSATYTNLEPGDYTFEVKAANNEGVWNNSPRTIHLTVEPPFWKTWGFKILIASLMTLITLWIANAVRRRIREKIATNKLISDLEIKALIAQMNPHFIFNSLTSIQELILTGKQKDAMHYLNRFSRLLRTVLECSEKNVISLEQEVLLLRLYLELESMRFDNQFHYHIHVDKEIDQEEIEIPSFLLQPFVENALWHGLMHKKQDRKLSVSFTQEKEGILHCRISDNGIGRRKAEELKKMNRRSYQSMGLKIMNERIELMRKENDSISLSIIDEVDHENNANGTTVVIALPTGSGSVFRDDNRQKSKLPIPMPLMKD